MRKVLALLVFLLPFGCLLAVLFFILKTIRRK